MQSLGKVPSARRPPANLPSLKAETSTPANDQSSTWGEQEGVNTGTQSATVINNNTEKAKTVSGGPPTPSGSLNTSTHSNSSSNQSGSTTWSSVTTGGPIEVAQPPLYQSPQFQHEFPSLDGTGAPTSKAGRGPASINDSQNNGDGQQLSLRPQTDASTWIQQNQQQNNSQGNQPVPAPPMPPQLRAVMPSVSDDDDVMMIDDDARRIILLLQ